MPPSASVGALVRTQIARCPSKAAHLPFALLTDKAETPDGNIEHKQWVDCNPDSVPEHARSPQNAYTGRQRPRDQNKINRYPGDGREAQSAEEGSDHEGEEGVADDAHGLEKGAESDESVPEIDQNDRPKESRHIHVSTQQLDLQRHDGFSNPHDREDPRKDQVGLVVAGADGQEHTQKQTKDERTPASPTRVSTPILCDTRVPIPLLGGSFHSPKIPIAQSLAHTTLENHIGVRPASGDVPQATPEPGGLSPFGRADAASSALQHAAHQVLRPEHLAQLLPDCQQIAGEGVPDALVDGVVRRATVLAGD